MRSVSSKRALIRVTALVAAAAVGGAGLVAYEGTHSPGATTDQLASSVARFPAQYAAPYLQIDGSDAGDMASAMAASGVRYFSLAFLIPQSGCTPYWEDDGSGVGAFASQISALQSAGGNVIPSFGGAQGGELAQTCTSVSALTAAYKNVVDTYHADRLDFDIEGGVLSDTAATTRRDQALAALQAEDPSVQVDFTLGVGPNGLPTGPGSEFALLQDAQSQGVKVSIVDLMTMDFGDGENALADAESAAEAAAGQLAGLYGISTSAAYNMMGLTPIAGQNDDDEYFSTGNASTLESFAASKGVAELSFWELDGYDKATGYQYSSIFNRITGSAPSGSGGGSGGTPTPSPSASPTRGSGSGTPSSAPTTGASGSVGSGGASSGPTATGEPTPPPAVTESGTPTPGNSTNFFITGQISCSSGQPVVGVWIQAAQGSGFASLWSPDNGANMDWWSWLPTRESFSLNVGCGGTAQSWAVSAHTTIVSGAGQRHISFNCFDIPGAADYKTCVRR
jgi:chitinase